MTNTPLKIGLLLNVGVIPAWVKVLVDELHANNYCTIALQIYNNGPELNNGPETVVADSEKGLVDRTLMKAVGLIHHRFAEGPSRVKDAFTPSDITAQLDGIDSLYVDTQKIQNIDHVSKPDLETIASYNLDVLVRIGFGVLGGDIIKLPKHGVWSLHYGDHRINRGGPPAFWETMQSWPTVGSMLHRLTDDINNGLILSHGFAPVDRFSIAHTRNNLYWKSQSMISRELKRLHLLGPEAFFDADRLPKKSDLQFYSQPLLKSPTSTEYLKLTLKKLVEKAFYIARNKRYLDQWILMYQFSDEPPTSPRNYTTLTPPKEFLWADPFAIERDGKYYVYFEEYPYALKKGHISVVELKKDGTVSEPEPCLVTDSHLSYPFLLEHENELYMIPESVADNSVKLYRCTEFPNKWEYVQDIMSDVQLVDATLHFKDGLWWLFGNQSACNFASRWDECNLYYTKDFRDGNWQPHPSNPISTDVRQARPAGAIFTHEGKLYRPAQDCSNHYGYGFCIVEINTLTTEEYKETLVSRVEPNWDKSLIGTHTYNRTGNLTVIDAIKLRKR